MGRFYQPAQAPQFVEGMYTPPWELIDKKLQENQSGYDSAIATANLFNDVDIQHIDDPILKAEAESLKNYYTGKVGTISEAIQKDPTSWKRNMPQIQKVGQELTNDMKNGRIADMQQQAASYQKFLKDHEEYRKKYGEDFNRGAAYYMEQFKKDPLRRGNFEYEQLNAPIDMDKGISEVLKLKASAVETSKGMYIVGTETVPKAQIEMSARNQIMGRPENRGYIQQQIRFKNPDYYNADYEKINPESGGFYERLYRNASTNEVISNEEAGRLQENYQKEKDIYDKFSEEKKAKISPPTPPVKVESGAVGRMVDEAVAAGFFEKHTLKSDPVQVAVMNAKIRQAIANADREFKREEANLSRSLETQKNNLSSLNTLRKYISELDPASPDYEAAKKKEAELINSTFNIAEKTSKIDPKTGEIETSPTNPTSGNFKLDIPSSMTELSKYWKDAKTSGTLDRNSLIFKEKLNDIKETIDKEKDATKRSRYTKFLNFYKSYAEKGELANYNIPELVEKFARENPIEKGAFKKREDNVYIPTYGGLTSPFSNTNNTAPLTQNVSMDMDNLRRFMGSAIAKADKDLVDLNRSGNTALIPVTEQGSKNLIKQIGDNPTSFTFYRRDPKSGVLSTKDYVKKLNLEDAEVSSAVNYSVGNGQDNAFIVKNSGGEFLVIPGDGPTSSFVEGILTSPSSIVGGKESPYIKLRKDGFAYNIASGLQSAPPMKDAKGNVTYSAPITIPTKGGDEQLIVTKIQDVVDGVAKPKYIVKYASNGEAIPISSTALYSSYDNTGKILVEGIADKLERAIAAENR